MSSIDWQPVIKNVERRLEGWQSKVMSKGEWLVLLRSVLSAIPLFYLSVFGLPWESWTPRRADEAVPMERTGIGTEPRLGDCILWDRMQDLSRGGLGVLHVQSMNMHYRQIEWIGLWVPAMILLSQYCETIRTEGWIERVDQPWSEEHHLFGTVC